MTENNLIECSIVFKDGAKEEVGAQVKDFFILRGIPLPPKIRATGNTFKLCIPQEQAESLAVVLDIKIPDLLLPCNCEGHGKIGLTALKTQEKDKERNDR